MAEAATAVATSWDPTLYRYLSPTTRDPICHAALLALEANYFALTPTQQIAEQLALRSRLAQELTLTDVVRMELPQALGQDKYIQAHYNLTTAQQDHLTALLESYVYQQAEPPTASELRELCGIYLALYALLEDKKLPLPIEALALVARIYNTAVVVYQENKTPHYYRAGGQKVVILEVEDERTVWPIGIIEEDGLGMLVPLEHSGVKRLLAAVI